MKLQYRYVLEGHTSIHLEDGDENKTKVKHNQVVESWRNPQEFLSSWFEAVGIKKNDVIWVYSSQIALEKAQKDFDKSMENLDWETRVKFIVSNMKVSEVKKELKDLEIDFKKNTWEVKLKEKLVDALVEKMKAEVIAKEEEEKKEEEAKIAEALAKEEEEEKNKEPTDEEKEVARKEAKTKELEKKDKKETKEKKEDK